MASSTQGNSIRSGSSGSIGRGFASMDPERRGEIVGYVQPIETRSRETARPAPLTWGRALPADRDASVYEGGSSRRSR